MMDNPLARDLDHILEHTRELWEDVRGQRLFITGGTGFFGCWLLESFVWANARLALGATATVLTRNLAAFQRKAPHLAAQPVLTFHVGDVRTFDFPAGEFTLVIHGATEASAQLNAEAPLTMLDTIVAGTRHTLDFALACGARRFLLTSSGAVYGKQPPELTHIPETYGGGPDPLDKRSAYGEGKRLAELLCALYASPGRLEPVIARCFTFVGPYLPLDAHFAIGNFIHDALAGGPIQVKGDGTPYRSYLYTADLAIWLWTILLRGELGRAYNVGSDMPVTIAEVAQRVAAVCGLTGQVQIAHPPTCSAALERYVPAIERANRELGLAVWIPLEEAVQRTWAYYRSNRWLGE